MQGSNNGHLNGHATHVEQINQYLANYAETEVWPDGALPFLARYRQDAWMWNHILDRSADYHIFPLDVEKQVDEWRRAHPETTNKAKKANQPAFTLLSDVQAMAVHWLWPYYMPQGKLTLLEGDPEVGKTWLSMDVMARLTRGEALPWFSDQTPSPHLMTPRFVVYMQAEDGVADTIRPRFDALGGDPSRLILLHGQRANGSKEEEPITLQDISVIESVLKRYEPALLVVDPLQAYLGARVDMHRANQTRPILTALSRLAEQYGCAVLCLRHLSKASQDRTLYRGLGSIDFAAAARSVLLAGFDPEDPQRQSRVLIHAKSSLAPQGQSLSYEIREGRFVWLGPSTMTAERFFARPRDEEEQSDLDEATEFLRLLLANGPLASQEIRKEAKKEGISEATLRRAKKQAGVKSLRAGAESRGQGRGMWLWQL